MSQNDKRPSQPPSHPSRPGARWLGALLGAESRWPAFAAALVIIVGQARLASSLQLQPVWLLPGLAAVLLIASIGFYVSPAKPDRFARAVSVGLAGVLVIANAGSFAMLVRDVFLGSKLTPIDLLANGVSLWVVNVLIFAIVYWELDAGGPEARLEHRRDHPDLIFPQQQADQEKIARADWQPSFGDYLYVSLTNGIAFSPTDTMPYTKRAKLAMGVQSVLSFAIAAVLVARAVNIARG
jgi:Protein of unknown function (DUF1345)